MRRAPPSCHGSTAPPIHPRDAHSFPRRGMRLLPRSFPLPPLHASAPAAVAGVLLYLRLELWWCSPHPHSAAFTPSPLGAPPRSLPSVALWRAADAEEACGEGVAQAAEAQEGGVKARAVASVGHGVEVGECRRTASAAGGAPTAKAKEASKTARRGPRRSGTSRACPNWASVGRRGEGRGRRHVRNISGRNECARPRLSVRPGKNGDGHADGQTDRRTDRREGGREGKIRMQVYSSSSNDKLVCAHTRTHTHAHAHAHTS